MKKIIVAIAVLMSGCGSLEALKTEPQADFCRHAGNLTTALPPHERAGHMLAAVEGAIDTGIERKFIRPQYREMILANKVALGMYECEVIAAFGTPAEKTPIQRPLGMFEQWEWGGYRWSNYRVYFDQTGVVSEIEK